ncbi:MAG: hypothetical protein IPO77_15795 [Acidobacteria bacterium]|nr:hypothetical protein [Acidobacteriota bacterium]
MLGVHDPESHFKGAEKRLFAVVIPDSEYLKAQNITNAKHEISFALDSPGREFDHEYHVRDYGLYAR